MELYGGEPFFQVLEAIEPSADLQIERSLALTTEACKISEARQKAIDSLKTGEEFRYKRHIASGDNLILRWSYQYVLEKLCAKEGLDKSKIKLETCSGEAISGNVSAIYRIDSFWELKHFYFSVISHFGLALGVEIDFEDTLNVPQPFVGTNHPDRVKTLEEGQRLRDELKKDHSEIVVVAQGGSKDEKRFSDSQVEDLVDQARDNFPDSYVVVASDKQYRRNENYNKPYGGKEDRAIFIDSLTDATPFFYASDTGITTDSFYGHLLAGCQVMRPDRGGKLRSGDFMGLYTLAFPEMWGIPGGHVVESPAVKARRAESPSPWFAFVEERDYRDFFGRPNQVGIDRSDFESLVADLPKLIDMKREAETLKVAAK